MAILRITLPPASGYDAGDVARVRVDGRPIGDAIDLAPGGGDFAGQVIDTADLASGLHTVSVTVSDGLGNAGAPVESVVFLNAAPRPAANLRFDAQDGAGPIQLAFDASADVV